MSKFYTEKMSNFIIKFMSLFAFLLYFAYSLSIVSESHSRKRKYKKNLLRVEQFKANMSQSEREYYEPRKRFIDKQSVKPSDDFFYQIDIILRGTTLREKNRRNIREIRKLEKFLSMADDFQLHRYFGTNEELYLGMKASKAIKSIKQEAKLDENWRRKNDPVFSHYLENKASEAEREFYKKNKALFFKMESGEELVQFLQTHTPKNESHPTDSKR